MSEDQKLWKKYHKDNDKDNFLMPHLRSAVEHLRLESVLEIGCGLGNNLRIFNCHARVGIDISEYAIKKAKERYTMIDFYNYNILTISTIRKFDLVFSLGVIEHIKPELLDLAFEQMYNLSNKYILNIEAYDQTEHVIDWHRGSNEFWTIDMGKRWDRFNVTVMRECDLDDEYRLTLVCKND